MKRNILSAMLMGALLGSCSTSHRAATALVTPSADPTLVILHTNDTHSHIDPLTDGSDLGGVARRKVLIDSVRAVQPNVLLIDAGDIVQGTLYFHLYKGAIEQEMLNELGYDVQILGNHEFDNGMGAMAKMYATARPTLLATNYDLTGSTVEKMFKPYVVKEYAGKRVGLFSINLNPAGMVSEGNYDGVRFMPWKSTTDSIVNLLRNREKVDYVIAVTHIGYKGSDENPDLFGDCDVAAQTSGIDLIIGAHSHTKLEPAVRVANANGTDSVTIVQTGRYGAYLGEITVNLANGTNNSRLIPVNSRLDAAADTALLNRIAPYRAGIDSLYTHKVANVTATSPLNNKNQAMLTFAANFVRWRGEELASGVEMAIANKGGLRTTWNPGPLSEGEVIDMMPFYNKVVVLDIAGSDLIEAFNVMEARGGDAVCGITQKADINPDKTYRIATIDYLANGGDYMTPLTRATRVAESATVAYDDLLRYLTLHPDVNP